MEKQIGSCYIMPGVRMDVRRAPGYFGDDLIISLENDFVKSGSPSNQIVIPKQHLDSMIAFLMLVSEQAQEEHNVFD